jgi:hypothetical protein
MNGVQEAFGSNLSWNTVYPDYGFARFVYLSQKCIDRPRQIVFRSSAIAIH